MIYYTHLFLFHFLLLFFLFIIVPFPFSLKSLPGFLQPFLKDPLASRAPLRTRGRDRVPLKLLYLLKRRSPSLNFLLPLLISAFNGTLEICFSLKDHLMARYELHSHGIYLIEARRRTEEVTPLEVKGGRVPRPFHQFNIAISCFAI